VEETVRALHALSNILHLAGRVPLDASISSGFDAEGPTGTIKPVAETKHLVLSVKASGSSVLSLKQRLSGEFRRLAAIDDLFDDLWSQEGETYYSANIAFADLLALADSTIEVTRPETRSSNQQ
jgi:hypothetical protein